MSNFKINDAVKFVNCGDGMSGQTGKILGTSSVYPSNTNYIVLLDNPMEDRLAIIMTQHCLQFCDGSDWIENTGVVDVYPCNAYDLVEVIYSTGKKDIDQAYYWSRSWNTLEDNHITKYRIITKNDNN